MIECSKIGFMNHSYFWPRLMSTIFEHSFNLLTLSYLEGACSYKITRCVRGDMAGISDAAPPLAFLRDRRPRRSSEGGGHLEFR